MATLAWSYEWKKGEYKICRFGLCGTLSFRNYIGLVYQILTGHPRFRVGLNKCVGACSNNLWSLIILCHLYYWLNKKGMNLYLEKHTHTYIYIYIWFMISFDTLCLDIHGKIGPNLWTWKNPTQTWSFYPKQKRVDLWLNSFFASQPTQPS